MRVKTPLSLLTVIGLGLALSACYVAPGPDYGYYAPGYSSGYYAPSYYSSGYYVSGYYGPAYYGPSVGVYYGGRWGGGWHDWDRDRRAR